MHFAVQEESQDLDLIALTLEPNLIISSGFHCLTLSFLFQILCASTPRAGNAPNMLPRVTHSAHFWVSNFSHSSIFSYLDDCFAYCWLRVNHSFLRKTDEVSFSFSEMAIEVHLWFSELKCMLLVVCCKGQGTFEHNIVLGFGHIINFGQSKVNRYDRSRGLQICLLTSYHST